MKKFMVQVVFLSLIYPVVVLAGVNDLTDEEVKIGWIQLFDGTMQSMNENWTIYVQNDPNTDERPGNLIVRDAVDGAWFGQTTGGGADIRTKNQFTNFIVEFQYRISGNSGFFYRGNLLTNAMFNNAVETAMLNNLDQINSYRTNFSGAIYDVYVPFADNYKTFATGEWNKNRIVARGDSVYHYHNDELYGKYDGNSDEFKSIIRGDIPVPGTNHISKWTTTLCYTVEADRASDCDHDNNYRQTGYFGLQLSYGGEQQYRGFKLLDLTAGCKDSAYEEYSSEFMAHDQASCKTLIDVGLADVLVFADFRISGRELQISEPGDYKIMVNDLMGKMVYTDKARGFGNFILPMNPGVYFLVIEKANTSHVQRIAILEL